MFISGEVFDITCFTGVNQYHALRVHGQCAATHLSSQHIRSVDFEMMCSPDESSAKSKSRKEAFTANTRDNYMASIVYMASIHLAWKPEPNHERITPRSFVQMQCSRDDFNRLNTTELDPHADIVTLIIDVVTDKRNLHFVKPLSSSVEALLKNVPLARSYLIAMPM